MPDFDCYFGEEPYYGFFVPNEYRYVFSYDSWDKSKDEIKKDMDNYFSALEKMGFSFENAVEKNGAEYYDFSNMNGTTVQVGNDYSLGHISIRVNLGKDDRTLCNQSSWRYGNNNSYNKDN